MPSASVLHLLTAPPQATPPDPGTVISATTPSFGLLTTSLLDPAVPAPGAAQVAREVKLGSQVAATYNIVFSRFLTRKLPAQVIGAGTWTLGLAMRVASGNSAPLTPGFCLAQWRPASGVVSRLVDNVAGGTAVTPTTNADIVSLTSLAGGAATLLAGDCLILEVWARWVPGGASTPDLSLLLGGLGQYFAGTYTLSQLTDTDAVLVAPAAITFT